MKVQELFLDGKIIQSTAMDLKRLNHQYFLMTCYLCNDSVLTADQNKNATEVALLEFSKLYNINLYHELEKYPRLSELSFDSNRKIMS